MRICLFDCHGVDTGYPGKQTILSFIFTNSWLSSVEYKYIIKRKKRRMILYMNNLGIIYIVCVFSYVSILILFFKGKRHGLNKFA
jgi:hypothetical protein